MILTAVTAARASGALDLLSFAVSPFAEKIGVPPQVVPLAVLRPFSGSGALAFFENLISEFGADGRIGEFAAVLCASTETTFYTIGVYLNGRTDRCGKIVLCAVIGDLAVVAAACLIV